MLTQIYEISSPEEARAISAIGVNHIGVLVGDGRCPREQSVETAMRIAAAILPPSKLSALFARARTCDCTLRSGPRAALPDRRCRLEKTAAGRHHHAKHPGPRRGKPSLNAQLQWDRRFSVTR